MPESNRTRRSSSRTRGGATGHRRDRRIRKYIFRALIVVAIVAVIGAAGYYGWRIVAKQRAIASARKFADKKEYLQAALSAKRALNFNPKDLSANRLMAEMAEAVQTKEAVAWRKIIAEMQPGVAENYLQWADTAIRFGDATSAREALSKVDAAGKNTSAYHDLAAKLEVLSGRPSKVIEHVEEAARLDPKNENFQLQLAAVKLGSPLPEVRKGAAATIEQLAESPKIRREALRVLIQSSLAGGDANAALKFANQLMTGPGAIFEDRMLTLKILGMLKRHEYWWFIGQLGADLPEKDDDLVSLLSWLNNNGLAPLTLKWTDELPNDRVERVPVCVAVAEAHALLANWTKLKPLLKFQKWGDLEFQREALVARVTREEGDESGSHSHWNAAVQLAGERREALSALARFAGTWKWDEEYTNLLWVIARGRNEPMMALQKLLNRYTAEGNTRELLSVFSRMLELEPQNLNTKNNVAYGLLILGMEPERAHMLANEIHNADPSNSEFAATYALSMHMKGKTDLALKVLQQLPEKELRVPATALTYGMILAAKGKDDEARASLAIAETGTLLPQERAILLKARDRLPRKP